MIKKIKDSDFAAVIKLASLSLDVWSGLNKNGVGHMINELSMGSKNVISKSSDPVADEAKEIVKKMLLATDRVMRKINL